MAWGDPFLSLLWFISGENCPNIEATFSPNMFQLLFSMYKLSHFSPCNGGVKGRFLLSNLQIWGLSSLFLHVMKLNWSESRNNWLVCSLSASWIATVNFVNTSLLSSLLIWLAFPGKHAPDGVKVLPLDLASGEDCLRDAVKKAESFFLNAGVDFMIHNAAIERPVSRQFLILECETLLVVETSIESLADLLASGFPDSKSAPLHWHAHMIWTKTCQFTSFACDFMYISWQIKNACF